MWGTEPWWLCPGPAARRGRVGRTRTSCPDSKATHLTQPFFLKNLFLLESGARIRARGPSAGLGPLAIREAPGQEGTTLGLQLVSGLLDQSLLARPQLQTTNYLECLPPSG